MFALIIYLCCGMTLAWRLLPSYRGAVKCWLGLVFGCVLLMWLPCLAAFLWGFTKMAQLTALIAALVAAASVAAAYILRHNGLPKLRRPAPLSRSDKVGLMACGFAVLFCAYLMHTHVLMPKEDGSLWVGQSTYGDLAMHLGFIESLYRQGDFPPDYSIFPGQQLNYPFLADAASASLRFFGLSLRMSVIAPSVVMLFCVFWGFWLLAEDITGRLGPTLTAWLLFVGNGGFGFVYFFGKYRFSEIFTGFYTTPTNLTAEDIRWTNVICDMLIPQRTTMAGWCVVLAAIWLLVNALRKLMADGGGRREFLVLAVLGGSLLMVHTHSFLALGILSAAWFFCVLPRAVRTGRARSLVINYVLYGVVCLALAAPQFFKWTMDSVSTGNLLRWNFGWVAGENGALNNILLFYVVNCGVVFVLMWPMLFFLRGERLTLFLGAAAIFAVANVVAFQPNLYDNNKLLYIWFMLTDILVCQWLWDVMRAAPRPLRTSAAFVVVLLGTFSGVLTMLREAVSDYQLFSRDQAAAAEFIADNTAPDSLFLTATSHTNPVSVLAGRDIVCGPGLYLYFHGVDLSEREALVDRMYRGGDDFPALAASLGVDYVYIGWNELSGYDVDREYFWNNYPLVYQAGDVSIFEIR